MSVGQPEPCLGTAYSQQGESRGSGEIPDLQGVYSIATVTMLERGEQFGGELVISAEQAAAVGETGAAILMILSAMWAGPRLRSEATTRSGWIRVKEWP